MLHTTVGIAAASIGECRDDVRRILLNHRHELLSEIQSRVRDARELGSHNHHHTADVREAFDAEPEDDLVFALIQMKAETLERVNEAVRHFDEGTYGCCIACGEAIASSRLRAMPFAVRCRDCEETREEERRQRGSQRVQMGSGSRC